MWPTVGNTQVSLRSRLERSSIVCWGAAHPTVTVIAAFALSRLCYAAIGVRFDATTIDIFNQILDRHWLQERLAESLFYIHGQPPLLNALIGAVLKISESQSTLIFAIIFIALGLLLIVAMYRLLALLQVSHKWAVAACMFFCVGPVPILYENWLMYTYPVATMLIAGFWFSALFVRRPKWQYGLLAALSLSAVALFRASFHVIWLAVLIGLMWRYAPNLNRRAIWALFFPLVLVVSWYLKNALVFGEFSDSSWFGMNWYNVVARNVPDELRRAQSGMGELQMHAGPFLDLSAYGGYVLRPEFVKIPALNEETKSSGRTNFNHYAFLEITRRFLRDDLVLLRVCPRCYAQTVGLSLQIYLRSASDYAIFNYNPRNMYLTAPIRWIYDRILYGEAPFILLFGDTTLGHTYPVLLIGVPLVLLGGTVAAFVLLNRRDARAMPVVGMVATCWLLSIVNILFDFSENNRYRFEIDPLLYVLAVFLLWNVCNVYRRRQPQPT